MTVHTPRRKWSALLISAFALVAAAGLAGCMGEEAGGGGNGGNGNGGNGNGGGGGLVDPSGPTWIEHFEVSDTATAVYLNLTMTGSGDFEACVYDPSGTVAAQATGTASEETPGFANFTFGEAASANGTGDDAGGEAAECAGASADASAGSQGCQASGGAGSGGAGGEAGTLTPGRWCYEVWSEERLLVVTELVVVEPAEETEA